MSGIQKRVRRNAKGQSADRLPQWLERQTEHVRVHGAHTEEDASQ